MSQSRSAWILVILLAAIVALVPTFMDAQERGQQAGAQAAGGQRGAGGGAQRGGGRGGRGAAMPPPTIAGMEVLPYFGGKLTNLFGQSGFTEYAMLDPSTMAFRITFKPTVGPGPTANAVGCDGPCTQHTNGTRAGSKASDIEVWDPRTGNPMKWVYEHLDNGNSQIRATLPMVVPEGARGRVLTFKTYYDPRSYYVHPTTGDVAFTRAISSRLGVVAPKGYSFVSSNVPAQISVTPEGTVRLAFTNPGGGGSDVTAFFRKTTATFTPTTAYNMAYDDIMTLYDLNQPETHTFKIAQEYSDARRGPNARLDVMTYAPLTDLVVIDMDTAKPLQTAKEGNFTVAKLAVPITKQHQSAALRVTGTSTDPNYKVENGTLMLDRTLHGTRNTILLPAGWEVAASSQPGLLGIASEAPYTGRAFIQLYNLTGEPTQKIVVRARKTTGSTSQQ